MGLCIFYRAVAAEDEQASPPGLASRDKNYLLSSKLFVVTKVCQQKRVIVSGETSTLGQGGQIAVVGARVKTVNTG